MRNRDLPPKSPRFKKNDTHKGAKRKLIQTDLPDGSRISGGVPDNIKIAIADAIMSFSEMEMAAEQFVWDILGLDPDDGKLVIQMDTKDKFEAAKKLSERYRMPLLPNPDTTSDAWSTIRTVIEARNKIAHGVWRMIDGVSPVTVSLSNPYRSWQN